MCAFRPVEGFPAAFLDDVFEQTAELKRLRVDPSAHREGLGDEMSAELESRAKAAGFEESVLDTAPQQTAARGFFDAQGLDCVG